MPIALLLIDTFKPLMRGLARLNPWVHLVELEETLIDRARSAFLVHWFGPLLPLEGRHLRVAIANIEDLRRRYLAVRRQAEEDEKRGPNLFEPLSGWVGSAAGVVLSPAGLLAMTIKTWRKAGWVNKTLAGALSPVVSGVGAAVAAALVPLLFGASVAAAAFGEPLTRAVYDMLGAAARFVLALNAFLAQLRGPRDKVKNPVIRRALEVGDHLAELVAQVVGGFSFLVARVGPLLPPLAVQFEAARSVGAEVLHFADAAYGYLNDSVIALFRGKTSPFGVLSGTFAAFPGLLVDAIDQVAGAVREIGGKLSDKLLGREGGEQKPGPSIGAEIGKAFKESAVAVIIGALIDEIAILKRAHWSRIPVPQPPYLWGDDEHDSLQWRGIKDVVWDAVLGGEGPTKKLFDAAVASSPSLPDLALPDAHQLSEQIREELSEVVGYHVTLPFDEAPAKQRKKKRSRKRAPAGRLGPAGILTKTLDQPRWGSVLRASFPPMSRRLVPDLRLTFDKAEAELAAAKELPVLLLHDSPVVKPVIRKIRIRTEGVDKDESGRFAELLKQALQAQDYPAVAAATAVP